MMDDFKEREDVDPFFFDPDAEQEYCDWVYDQLKDERWENEE